MRERHPDSGYDSGSRAAGRRSRTNARQRAGSACAFRVTRLGARRTSHVGNDTRGLPRWDVTTQLGSDALFSLERAADRPENDRGGEGGDEHECDGECHNDDGELELHKFLD